MPETPPWSRREDLNLRPAVYETAALPAELRRRTWMVPFCGQPCQVRDHVLRHTVRDVMVQDLTPVWVYSAPMEGIELHVALGEVKHLVGARLSRVHQVGDVLILRTYGPSASLALDPGGKAFHQTDLRPPAPPAPPPFCQLVRRLCGQPLVAVQQAGFDRVLRLRFPEADLVLDLRPRQGEVFLLWRTGRVDALRGSSPRDADFDSPGDPAQGIGPQLRRAAEAWGASPERLAQELLQREPQGYLYETERGLVASFFPREELGDPVATMGTYWQALDPLLERQLVGASAQSVRERLRRATRRRQRALETLEQGRAEAGRWPELKSKADLILTRLSEIPHGVAEVEVEGFDGTPVRLSLEPSCSPTAYAQALYRRARKLRRRLEYLPHRRDSLERERSKLEELSATLAQRPDLAPYLEETLVALGEEGPARPRGNKSRAQKPPAQAREIPIDGFTVQVGRSARENDALVRKARGDDLWFHARGVPGAHVLVSSKGRPVPANVLHRAAELAAWHSQARGERTVEVSYTEGRYLRKRKGAPPGAVVLLRENVVHVPGDRGP